MLKGFNYISISCYDCVEFVSWTTNIKIIIYVEKLTKQQYLVCEIENYFSKDWLKLKQIHARNFNKMNICKLIWQVLAHFHIQNDFV
jgi:hypothetical protein